MGWLQEKYTKAYYLHKDPQGNPTPYGVHGVEYWQKGEIYPEAYSILEPLNLKDSRVLDIGFGRGEAIRFCIENGAEYAIGVDFAEPAMDITSSTLSSCPKSKYRLVCQDILCFLDELAENGQFTHILMFDVIEHIPRHEVEVILPKLYSNLIPGGLLIVHTPFFPEDDNVLETGGKSLCEDSSDWFEETQGMHNRYSYDSLNEQLQKFSFVRGDDYTFFRPN
jgi:SAM-dependent methyltransferase